MLTEKQSKFGGIYKSKRSRHQLQAYQGSKPVASHVPRVDRDGQLGAEPLRLRTLGQKPSLRSGPLCCHDLLIWESTSSSTIFQQFLIDRFL